MKDGIAHKEERKKWNLICSLGLTVLLSSLSDATVTFRPLVCAILTQVTGAIQTAGATLVLIMFTYGAVKYAFSADDPSGRKAGKMTCIHALIAGILIVTYSLIYNLVSVNSGWWNPCP
jgi:hypothetical protein